MTRLRAALLALFCVSAAALTVRHAPAQPGGEIERVYYRDRAKDGKVEFSVGELKETAAGVQVIGTDKKLKMTVSPADVVRIEYTDLKNVDPGAYLTARTLDAGPDPAKAAAAYAKLLADAGATAPPKTKRALAFREMILAAKANDAEADPKKFADAAKPIADRLAAFTRNNLKTWECWQTATTAARLYVELRDSAKAAETVHSLVENADLLAELRNDARLMEVGYMIMSPGRAAHAALADIQKDAAALTARQKERATILAEVFKIADPVPADPSLSPEDAAAKKAVAEKVVRDAVAAKVEPLIAKAKESSSRAAGYNAVGEMFLRHGQFRDAMWAFLWVDVVYGADKDEHLKAVVRLVQVFEATGDKDREAQFRDRLLKAR